MIILTGPTAVGKTSLSIALAKAVNGEESFPRTPCRSIAIWTSVLRKSARRRCMEFPIIWWTVWSRIEEFNVVRFQQMAKEAMEGIYARGRIPVLVGGTGLRMIPEAVAPGDIDFTGTRRGYDLSADAGRKAKAEVRRCFMRCLPLWIPHPRKRFMRTMSKRVIRALEYYQQTGKPISQHNEEQRQKESPYNLAYFVLNDDRSRLYERIDARIDQMLDEGLIDEVKALKEMGYHKGMVSMQGLGYKEILSYLDGTWSLEEAVYVLKRDTRHFAKRQITWFKRERQVEWFDKQEFGYDSQANSGCHACVVKREKNNRVNVKSR